MHKITGNPENFEHLDVLKKLIKQYVPFAQQKMGFDKPVDINLLSDRENSQNPLGKTAFYDPNMMKITLFVDGRHVKDIMRSLSHEMVHHTQNCQGKFSSGINTDPGYAQNDEHLRNQEKQAYLVGNLRFRDWEDGIKQQQESKKVKNKSLINEIVEIIYEEFNSKNINEIDIGKLKAAAEKAGKVVKGAKPKKKKPSVSLKKLKTAAEKAGKVVKRADKLEESDKSHPGVTEDQAKAPGGAHPGKSCAEAHGEKEETNENWFKGNKDQLLFEELTKIWTKKR